MKAFYLSILMALALLPAHAQRRYNAMRETKKEFFKTEQARLIGDQILDYQRVTGGWPKNIDMAKPMTHEERQQVLNDKSRRDDSTTDNDATNMQMTYLARLYQATKSKKYREAFCQGVEYLLSGQYDNGGWPQFWPGMRGYQVHITFNDDAIVNTMEMLRDIYLQKAPFDGKLTDKALDPCPWGLRVYYYGCEREGGDSGWLRDNLDQAPGHPAFHGLTALWTFDGKWDPEARIRDLCMF